MRRTRVTLARVIAAGLAAISLTLAAPLRADPPPARPADIAKAMGIQRPFVHTFFSGGPSNPSAPDPGLFQVPATQRLIIEYVSGSCAGVGTASLDGLDLAVSPPESTTFPVFHTLNVGPVGADFPHTFQGNFGHLTRIYVDPGMNIQLTISSSGSGTAAQPAGKVECRVTVNGQLVDVP
ncbi:MAG TPA: hypothetical protein VFI80_08935 [Burkholderiales bacterium]|nr:hypothetical protein [Burkholderiales bacterium]